jgi:hypothetical protein
VARGARIASGKHQQEKEGSPPFGLLPMRFHTKLRNLSLVMPALVAGIHVFCATIKDVDGRDKPGHDGGESQGLRKLVLVDRARRPIWLRNRYIILAYGTGIPSRFACFSSWSSRAAAGYC